jgi:hypothetical protein
VKCCCINSSIARLLGKEVMLLLLICCCIKEGTWQGAHVLPLLAGAHSALEILAKLLLPSTWQLRA